METASPLVSSDEYVAERKQDDFNQLRQAAMERADGSSRIPTVVLPGAKFEPGTKDCSWIIGK